MAGKKGQSGPPGNANAFQHGLVAVQRRRADGELTEEEQDIRTDILAGLVADKGGEQQIGTAERILAEIISSDVALLVTFNQALRASSKIIRKPDRTPKRWLNWTATNGLWSGRCRRIYSGSAWRVAKFESLQEIIEEMRKGDGETENNG
jgi:hypothetical protein